MPKEQLHKKNAIWVSTRVEQGVNCCMAYAYQLPLPYAGPEPVLGSWMLWVCWPPCQVHTHAAAVAGLIQCNVAIAGWQRFQVRYQQGFTVPDHLRLSTCTTFWHPIAFEPCCQCDTSRPHRTRDSFLCSNMSLALHLHVLL